MVHFRFALRTMFKTPFVTICVILSIALGIGANTAVFSIFEQVLLRPLPVQEPDRLVNLSAPGPKRGSSALNGAVGNSDEVFSYPMFRDLERVQTVFTGIAAHRQFRANLASRGLTLNTKGVFVSGSYFSVLGVRPALGRLLGPTDDHSIGGSHVVVLSHDFWNTRFGGNPGVLNRTMMVNGQVMTIVGVTQRGFNGTTVGTYPQVFVPITMRGILSSPGSAFDNRRHYWAYLFARLKPGISVEQASAAINGQFHAIVNEIEAPLQQGLSEKAMAQFIATPLILRDGSRGQNTISKGEAKTWLNILFGITAFVLIIACANVANLLLARGATRAAEISLRLSLGASRRQVVLQLFEESCLLALIAGCVGILIAQWTLDLIALLFPVELLRSTPFSLSLPAFLFAAVLAFITSLIFGLYPAIHSTRLNLIIPLKANAAQLSNAKSTARFRNALVCAQIALSLSLLAAAGLFTKSLFNINRENLGMKIDNVITFRVSPLLNSYSHQRSLQLYERMEDELAALPGVTGVTSSSIMLLNRDRDLSSVVVEGYTAGPDTDMTSLYHKIGSSYFSTLGIPLLSGREFTRSDTAGARKVAIVNEAFADKFNLGRDIIGKHIGSTRHRPKSPDMEIVGVVQNSKFLEVTETVPPMYFYPYRQADEIRYLTFYVKTSLNPEQFLPNIRKLMTRVDPNLPVENLRTMPQQVRANISMNRNLSILSAAFACLATVLAVVGLYGVIAYMVTQRTREIGLRIAIGATQAQVRSLILRQVGLITIIGCMIGLALGLFFGRITQSMLFRLEGSDPVVFLGTLIIMTMVALIAGFIPAYRASKIDPMSSLRYE